MRTRRKTTTPGNSTQQHISNMTRRDINTTHDKINDDRSGENVVNAENTDGFNDLLLKLWNDISALDKKNIFASPVTEDIAPSYFSIV